MLRRIKSLASSYRERILSLVVLPVVIAQTPTLAGIVPFLAAIALLAAAVMLRASPDDSASGGDKEEDRLAAALPGRA